MRNTYLLLAVSIVIAAAATSYPYKQVSVADGTIFLTVIGVTYGLISAFSINNADKCLDQLRDSFAHEASSLRAIFLMSRKLKDNSIKKKIKHLLEDYCKDTINLDIKEYENGVSAHEKFNDLANAVFETKSKMDSDNRLLTSMTQELVKASSLRDEQIVLARDRLPATQWALELFLSIVLISGLSMTNFQDSMSHIFVFMLNLSVLVILVVIYKLDSVTDFEEEVSNEPYRSLLRLIQHTGM